MCEQSDATEELCFTSFFLWMARRKRQTTPILKTQVDFFFLFREATKDKSKCQRGFKQYSVDDELTKAGGSEKKLRLLRSYDVPSILESCCSHSPVAETYSSLLK